MTRKSLRQSTETLMMQHHVEWRYSDVILMSTNATRFRNNDMHYRD